jgi:hypothetical protein
MSKEKQKGRKIGRNANKCKRYRDEMRQTKNRRKRDLRIAKRYDKLAILATRRSGLVRGMRLIELSNIFAKRAKE